MVGVQTLVWAALIRVVIVLENYLGTCIMLNQDSHPSRWLAFS